MLSHMPITRVAQSRLSQVDFDNLSFGGVFSDHMFSMEYRDGQWAHPAIIPYQPITLEPGTAMLHYGQTIFEGMKAFRGKDAKARIFRPGMNARRMAASAERMCMPPVDEALFVEAVRRLVAVDHDWLPHQEGQALYVRPLMFGTEPHLDVRPDTQYRLLIMSAPVGSYFKPGVRGVRLKAEDRYTRAATSGGVGFAKTAGNYAASMLASSQARQEGYDQVLWLDGHQHRHVEEVGAMNIFFVYADRAVTPPLTGSILPGVTRDSVIELLKSQGHPVEEARLTITEVMQALQSGAMQEVFGAGTAAVISPVAAIHHQGTTAEVPQSPGELTRKLYDEITGIQSGRLPDTHGWCEEVPLDAGGENTTSSTAAPLAAER